MAAKQAGKKKGGLTDIIVSSITQMAGATASQAADAVNAATDPPSRAGAASSSIVGLPDENREAGIEVVPTKPAAYSKFIAARTSVTRSGTFQSGYEKGYEARFAARTKTVLDGRHNGVLSFSGARMGIPLFVTELTTDFSLNGNKAQSASGTVFYPSNFNQTSIKVVCQSPNPLYSGKVMEAIRDSQSPFAKVSNLHVAQRNSKATIIRGTYEPITCNGYVSMATRSHATGQYSTFFELDFTVVQFTSPKAWSDTSTQYLFQQDWHKLITPTKDNPMTFEKEPDIAKTANEQQKAQADSTKNAAQQEKDNADKAALDSKAAQINQQIAAGQAAAGGAGGL